MLEKAGQRRIVGIEIKGGLGNQLFQYATAYALAQRLDADLALDTRLIRKSGGRPLMLARLGLPWIEMMDPEARGFFRVIGRRLGRNSFPGISYRERSMDYDPMLAGLRGSIFLHGFFQSPRYFDPVATDIRRLFDPTRFTGSNTAVYADVIRAVENPVMVHLRRGDYSPIGVALPTAYYDRVRLVMEGRVDSPSYFVFSDEPVVARKLFRDWPGATVVAGLSDLEDLHLMSLCRHFIIANSTFSWWAAWLGEKGGTTIAPKEWFPLGHHYSRDLFPPNWTLL